MIESALHRSGYYEILSKHLGLNYEKIGKSKTLAKRLYEDSAPFQPKSITCAQRLLEQKKDEKPSGQNPVTTVFELVLELNNCLRDL